MSEPVLHIEEDGSPIGLVSRAEADNNGLLHQIAVVYVIDAAGAILVQERSDGRFDHSAAGHVDGEESPLIAAERELAEELGITGASLEYIGQSESEEFGSPSGSHVRHRYQVFCCEAEPVRLQPGEVESVSFWDVSDVRQAMTARPEDFAGGFVATLPLIVAHMERRRS